MGYTDCFWWDELRKMQESWGEDELKVTWSTLLPKIKRCVSVFWKVCKLNDGASKRLF
jgi:hypothetical protein